MIHKISFPKLNTTYTTDNNSLNGLDQLRYTVAKWLGTAKTWDEEDEEEWATGEYNTCIGYASGAVWDEFDRGKNAGTSNVFIGAQAGTAI